MLKNKKKLRRLERHTHGYAARAAQTLVLAGAFVLGGAGLASAADITITSSGAMNTADTNALTGAEKVLVTGTGAAAVEVTFADALVNTNGGLTITGATNSAAVTVNENATFKGAVIINGVVGNTGTLDISTGKTFTSSHADGTSIGTFGVLKLTGPGATHVGNVTVDDANATLTVVGGTDVNTNIIQGALAMDMGATTVDGYLKVTGAATLGNGADAELTLATTSAANVTLEKGLIINGNTAGGTTLTVGNAAGATIQGDVTLTKGTLDLTAGALNIGGALTVNGAAADAVLGLNANNALTVTTLKALHAVSVDGMLTLANMLGSTADVTLDDGGVVKFHDGTVFTDATLNKTGAAKGNLVLGTGGSLEAGMLTLNGFSNANAVGAAANTTALTADKLIMSEATTFGAITTNGATDVTIRSAATDTTAENFINQDITLKGYTGNVGTLNLGTTGTATGTATTDKSVTLAGNSNANEAMMNVGYSTFKLGVINVGGSTDVAANAHYGSVDVANGGTLTADTINLHGKTAVGDATLDIAGAANATNTVNVTTLNVGGANTFGTVTVTGNATNGNSVLNVTNLNLGTNGQVDVAGHGTLNINKDYTMVGANLVTAASSAPGKLSVAANGMLAVDGNLTLTDNNALVTTAVTTAVDGTVKAKTLTAQNVNSTAVPTGMSWNGGTLTLTGTGTVTDKVINASSMKLDTGGMLTLNADSAMGGGTYDKKITVTDGTLTAGQGTWHVNQLDVAVTDGQTSITGNLVIDGAVSGDLKSADAGDGTLGLNVGNTGTLTATATVLFENLATDFTRNTNIETIDLAAGGLLKIAGLADSSITLSQTAGIGANLKTGNGLIDYGKALTVGAGDRFTTVEGLNGTVQGTLADNSGAQLKETVGYDENTVTNPTVTTGGFGAKDLLVKAATGTTKVDVTLSNSLTLLGGAQGSSLVNVVGDTDKKVLTNISVASGFGLTFGNAETLDMQGGTLNGNVVLQGIAGDNNGSALTVVKGMYEVKNITGTAFDTVTVTGNGLLNAANVDLGKLAINGGTLDASGTIDAVSANIKNGQILSIADSTFTGDVTLENGVIDAGDIGAPTGNLAVGGSIITIAGSKNAIVSGNNITVDNFKQMMADGTTVAGISNAIIIAGKDFTVTADGFDAKGVTLDVGGALKTTDSADVIAGAKSNFTIQTLDMANTGQVIVMDASTLTVESLTLAATKTVSIGSASVADEDIKDGSMLSSAKTNLNGGSLLVQNAKASLGELTAATGSIFVDPAYVNIDSIKGEFGASLLAGAGGQITVGGLNEAWVQQVIKTSGAAADNSVLGINKSIALATNGTIVVDTAVDMNGSIGAAPITNTVYFGDKSLLALDGSQFLDGTKPAAIAGKGQAIFVQNAGDTQARLHITSVKTGDTVHVLSGVTGVDVNDSTQNAGWLNNNITFDTELFKGEGVTNAGNSIYNVNVRNVGAQLIFPKLSSGMAGLVDNVMGQYGLQTDSNNAGVRFVSRAVSNNFGLGGRNADKAAATIEGAAQMGAVAGVQMSTIGAANAASGAVITRTSFAQPLMDMSKAVAVHQDADGALSLDSGLSAGNGMNNGLGVWIMPLYQSNKTWGQKAENFKSGMSSDLGGIAFGADYTINDMFRFGAAFNTGAGYGQSSGDFNKTDNKFNFWGVNLYGGWTMNNMGLSADVGYTSNYNKVEQEMPAAMAMGKLKSDITSSAWTAGLKGEYKIETSLMDIIPHVGVRYMGLATDSYDVKSGGTVFGVEKDFQSIWTFPVGVAFSKSYTTDSGWMFKPQVDLSVIPAAGDINAKSKSHIPGVMGNAEMKMQVVDTMTYDAGLGIEMGKDNLSFGVNYNIQASEHRTGHGVFGTLRYEF